MAFLIQTPSGEQMIVSSMKGHSDCKVIVKGVKHPAHGYARLHNGKWVADTAARDAAAEEARLRGMSRAGLVDHIIKSIGSGK